MLAFRCTRTAYVKELFQTIESNFKNMKDQRNDHEEENDEGFDYYEYWLENVEAERVFDYVENTYYLLLPTTQTISI